MTRASDVANILKQPFTNTLGTSNYRAGVNAGDSIASGGNYNIAIGDEAGTAITTGDHNTAIGFSALDAEDGGTASVAVGNYALGSQNSDGNNYNTAVGYVAGSDITTGINNTFIGALCGDAQTVADNNTAVGYEALTTNTVGSGSVAIGYRALKVQNYSSATDSLNVAVGNNAGAAVTTGVQGVYIGALAGDADTTGGKNTYVGYNSGTANAGDQNVFIGHSAGSAITNGDKNTFVGKFDGNQNGLDLRTADNQIVLSDGDGEPHLHIHSGYTDMSNDISASARNGSTAHLQHQSAGDITAFIENSHNANPYGLYIHFSGAAPDDNSHYFLACQDSSATRIIMYADGDIANADNSFGGFSDEKLKEQIKDASSQWDDIKALKVRKFKMKDDVAKGDNDAHWRLGVVAQEVETAGMKGLVKDNPDLDPNTNEDLGTTTKSVKYSILYMKAVKALQEAMTRIETLEAKVTALESK